MKELTKRFKKLKISKYKFARMMAQSDLEFIPSQRSIYYILDGKYGKRADRGCLNAVENFITILEAVEDFIVILEEEL